MRRIHTVHLHDTGPEVANLQKGLSILIQHQPGISPNDRETWQRRLAPELDTQTFGHVTRELVGMWQYQFKYWPDYLPAMPDKLKLKLGNLSALPAVGTGTGDVDELTVELLNWLLGEFGALQPESR